MFAAVAVPSAGIVVASPGSGLSFQRRHGIGKRADSPLKCGSPSRTPFGGETFSQFSNLRHELTMKEKSVVITGGAGGLGSATSHMNGKRALKSMERFGEEVLPLLEREHGDLSRLNEPDLQPPAVAGCAV